MSDKIGRFEIVSQIAQSPFATVYKATDAEAQQTVALKVFRLEAVADRAALTSAVVEEAERAKPLSSHNIAGLYGVGDEGDLLLASAEYVQGNSVATTLARHEGFSIWDLQDIARQVCQGLDHAHGHKVVHRSLEPAKIMVQWDGLVKVLGFGISSMNATSVASPTKVPEVLHYASPEQLRGEGCDHRSALFSLGAILYEMATEQKPFGGATAEEIRTAILESTPPLPHRLKGNVNPALSALIMKALSKLPEERFQSGQELVRELEQCKSPGGLAAKAASVATPKAPQAPRQEEPRASAAAAGVGVGLAAKPVTSTSAPNLTASVAPAEEQSAFAVDPLMAGEASPVTTPAKSFSDIAELPPLKEVRIAPVIPAVSEQVEEPAPEPLPAIVLQKVEPEKPKAQVRAAARKAVTEIRKTPPQLYLYAIGGAVALIAIIVTAMAIHNYVADRDAGDISSAVQQPVAPVKSAVRPTQPAVPPPAEEAAAQPQTQPEQELEPPEERPEPRSAARGRKVRSRSRAVAVVPAQLSVSSSPDGASIAFDGSVLCQSPCTLTGIVPGQHTVSASKDGYGSASQMVSLGSGANSSVSLQLDQLTAILSVGSTPAGAAILIDGKDSGKLTPAKIVLHKPGMHAVTLRRYGYLDASDSVNLQLGQTSSLNLSLSHLGNTDEIRAAGGRFKKMFGHGDATGMGIVSVKTQPKGAQIMVNSRVLDKTAPFDFYLNPGTYVLDITMSGYKSVHRVIVVQEGEKVAIEETLLPE
jgi:eukaryotic-like serine/threonine-protein kinase